MMGRTLRLRTEIEAYLSNVGEANTTDILDHVKMLKEMAQILMVSTII